MDTEAKKLGTFAGVFTPSILTILGIILFLRLGYVVGHAGLGHALIIIGLANAISVFTTFSLSAIATNLKVKGGGDYYLISRTLGLEFGGAIGIVLFLAQSVSIAFYCIGFGEVVASIFYNDPGHIPQIIAALAVAFLFIFAWLGADWATKFQYVVMTILTAALVSFFVGGFSKWDSSTLISNWSGPLSRPDFWVLFAIFFPAVTGFTQGVSMSGDLVDAGRSLPLGTFIAVGLSILVYFGSAIVFASALPNEVLATDYEAMRKIALFDFLVIAGVIAATLSSAMASFLGAPRILQSLAGDRIFPVLLPFSKGYGPNGNPRRSVLLSAGIAFATISLGKLNLIAPVVSMFFLISYGLLNYATYYEAKAASPSFRPRFRWFHPNISLLGCIACIGAMLAIDLRSGIVAISLLFAIYQYIKRTAGPSRWADSRRSYHLQRVRENLLAASVEPEHPRDWRPQILAFSNDSERRERLLYFSSLLEGGSGLTTAVKILEGEGVRMFKLKSEAEAEFQKDISQYDFKTFPLVLSAPNFQIGVQMLIQSFGIGPVRSNIVLINWVDDLHKDILGLGEFRFTNNLRVAFRYGCNIVLLDAKDDAWKTYKESAPVDRIIDVWWQDDSTGRLMLLLAYLLTRNEEWEDSRIRLLISPNDKPSEKLPEEVKSMLQEVRINAEPVIVENADEDKIADYSAGSTIVFLPFRIRGKQIEGMFGHKPDELVSRLPFVFLVLAAKDIDLDAEPEEGKAGELAAALDALADAEKKARKAREEAEKAAEEAEKAEEEARTVIIDVADKEKTPEYKSPDESKQAKDQVEKAARKAAKAEAKVMEAAREAEELGAKIEKDEKVV